MSIEVAKSISKSVTVLTGSRMVTYLSGFILMLFLPRYLGPEEYGRLYLGISIVSILSIITSFGGQFSISKAVARSHEDTPNIVVNAVGGRLVLWVVSVVGVMAFCIAVDYPPTVRIIILIFGIALLWQTVKDVLWSCFQGHEMMEYPSFGGIAESVLVAGVGIVALLMGGGAIVIAAVMAISSFVNFLVSAFFAKRIIPSLPRLDWKQSFSMLKTGIPYFLWSIFGIIYYRIDSVMLSLMTPEAVVGWYGAAYRFFDTLMFVPNIFSIAIFPVLARLWNKEDVTLALTTQKSVDFILMIGIPISVGTFAFAEQIIQILFGLNAYSHSVILLRIFGVGLLLVYIDWVIGTALFASEKQKQWSVVAFFAVLLNVSLNYLLIPYTQAHQGNGGIGSAIATLCTEFFVMLAAIKLMPKGIFESARIDTQFKAVAAGLLMGASIWIARSQGMPWIGQAVLAVIVYFAALLSFKTLKPSELSFLLNFLSFRNLKTTFVPNKEKNV